jgi:hypothetical protein
VPSLAGGSTSTATFGRSRAFSMRRRVRDRFGFASTALYTVFPERAKTIGTRCGRPSGSIVASRATRAARTRSLASASCTRLGYGSYSASVFAAMTKSLRCRPLILCVHQATVVRPHSVSSAG